MSDDTKALVAQLWRWHNEGGSLTARDAADTIERLERDRDALVERIAPRPDFPTPMRIDGKGHPRWLRSEVMAWARRHQG